MDLLLKSSEGCLALTFELGTDMPSWPHSCACNCSAVHDLGVGLLTIWQPRELYSSQGSNNRKKLCTLLALTLSSSSATIAELSKQTLAWPNSENGGINLLLESRQRISILIATETNSNKRYFNNVVRKRCALILIHFFSLSSFLQE